MSRSQTTIRPHHRCKHWLLSQTSLLPAPTVEKQTGADLGVCSSSANNKNWDSLKMRTVKWICSAAFLLCRLPSVWPCSVLCCFAWRSNAANGNICALFGEMSTGCKYNQSWSCHKIMIHLRDYYVHVKGCLHILCLFRVCKTLPSERIPPPFSHIFPQYNPARIYHPGDDTVTLWLFRYEPYLIR